jgi:antitoxin ParD1/3/4
MAISAKIRIARLAMNIHLTEHFEKFIETRLKSGHYGSASEVVRDALRLLEEREQIKALKLKVLKEEIQKGLDSGDPSPFDPEAIKKKARSRQANKKA